MAQHWVPAEQQCQQQRAPRSAPGPHAPAAGLGRLSPGALSLAPASPPPSTSPPPPPLRLHRCPAAPARALRGGSGSHTAQRAARNSERDGRPAPALETGSGAPLSALLRLRGSERSPGSRVLAPKLSDQKRVRSAALSKACTAQSQPRSAPLCAPHTLVGLRRQAHRRAPPLSSLGESTSKGERAAWAGPAQARAEPTGGPEVGNRQPPPRGLDRARGPSGGTSRDAGR